MIRITQLKLPAEHRPEDLKKKAARLLNIPPEKIQTITIKKRSLDARKKPQLFYSYIVDVKTPGEEAVVKKAHSPNISMGKQEAYQFVPIGSETLAAPPVVIGTGPAGLFCGLMLARHGYGPILLERGDAAPQRKEKVEAFWQTGVLDLRSNVQFGEGGAGTFSDGKLNTLVKDPNRRNQLVLETFVEFGADPSILYEHKPHIGTDVLSGIVERMREEIIRLGGQVRFGCQVVDFIVEQGRLTGIITNDGQQILTQVAVLAIGHSARDTFEVLHQRGIAMEAKSFAVGLRIQHPQAMIDLAQYGRAESGDLGAASYKLTYQTKSGRGVYSFCMCPGGYVVNASSEPGRLAVNGMSYQSRAGANANSALIVTVTPADFPDQTALGGVAFQQKLEEMAFACADGAIPIQLAKDFLQHRISTALGDVKPQMKGGWAFAPLHQVLLPEISQSLAEGIAYFGTVIPGFDRPDAILAGVESRTSSPVRIPRGNQMEHEVKGVYPCGEGAGYAGGITSAAMDGIKAAEAIAMRYDSRIGKN